MATTDPQRNYNMIDADLCMLTSNLCNFLTRDVADLGVVFGITAQKIAALKALGDAFEVFPTDGSILGDVMLATQNKNNLREQVLESIRNMALRVEAKWTTNSPQYRRLDLNSPSGLTDNLLLVAARIVHTKVTEYLADLAGFGLTQQVLDDFEDQNSEFELAINAQIDAVATRDMKKLERIAKGNEIYELVVTYSNFGKRFYEKRNSAKYNDYIIYVSSSPGSLTAPTDLYFHFPSRTFSWSEVENATSYQLEWSIDGDEANYVEIYSGSDTSFTYNDIASPLNYLRVRARNANGFGLYSDVLEQGYFVTLPPPVNLSVSLISGSTDTVKLTFNAVPSANVYKIYRSTANVGDVAGSFVYAGQSSVNEFEETLALGHRYYYRCTAENPYQTSTNSNEVYIEL